MGRGPSAIRCARVSAGLLVGALVLALVCGGALAVKTKKVPTKVSLRVTANPDTSYTYKIKVKPKPKSGSRKARKKAKRACRRGRSFLVFHDEDGNGTLELSEYVIYDSDNAPEGGRVYTNKRGAFRFTSFDYPPAGDKIVVIVDSASKFGKKFYKCRSGKASVKAF